MSTPILWLVAGPNGAGKSTIVARHNKDNLPVVNPDVIVASLTNLNDAQKHIIAGRQALAQQKEFIKSRTSFIVETTFSGRAGFNLVRKAKEAEFQVNLIYMVLKSYQQSIGRVYSRALGGGHDVPIKDIKRRFDRVRHNIHDVLPQANNTYIIDNTGLRPVLINTTCNE